jgi:hypothetical protein
VAGKPDVDLDSMTAEQLTNLINMAQAKRAEKLEEARAALITEMAKRRWSSAFRSISSTPWPREPAGLAPTADARRERIPERPCRPSIVVRAARLGQDAAVHLAGWLRWRTQDGGATSFAYCK